MKAVILAHAELFDPVRLGTQWAAMKGLPLPDALHEARQWWGILGENMAEEDARRTSEAWAKAGVGCRVIEMAKLAALPPPAPAAGLSRQATSCVWRLRNGQSASTDCKEWAVISAFTYQEEDRRVFKPAEGPSPVEKVVSAGLFMATGLPIRIGQKKKDAEVRRKPGETVSCLDILGGAPLGRWRIEAAAFDYSCLGAAKQYSALLNYSVLLKDLTGAAPQALRSRGARIVLEKKPMTEMEYPSLEAAERELRWLVTLSRLPPEDPSHA